MADVEMYLRLKNTNLAVGFQDYVFLLGTLENINGQSRKGILGLAEMFRRCLLHIHFVCLT